ncbi:ATP-dependent DNA ligase [Spirillospora sp. NPDC048911]|uniref:ATP-dependent DNA ligase n=1 Tax=Spirillospora sp. NPDC048911 TaxID=3364527 RepID=UPI00371A1791
MHIRGPVAPMLAKSVDDFPDGDDWVYEPKFDGFRCQAHVRDHGQTELYSRSLTRLTGSFPETTAAITERLPAGTVVDGELVHWSPATGKLDFEALQQRLGSGRRRALQLARRIPISYVVFDCLETAERGDLRNRPLRERRSVLEGLLRDAPATGLVLLCPQETSRGPARLWLELLTAQAIEGVVIKAPGGLYRPGVRGWYKLKHRDETLAIVGGYTGTPTAVTGLLVGRHPGDGGRLRVVGRTGPPPARLRDELAPQLIARRPAQDDHPWPAELPAGWAHGLPTAAAPIRYHRVQPTLVVEIAVDIATSHGRWRHLARLEDIRAELRPADVPKDLDLE